MLRSRLKNIINKSKEINKQNIVGDPFDRFIETLPKELILNENYRMKAAWKAYGSPKNYKEALWEGMILPIDENTFKLPSIGYNEETEEYEYLNKGRENETVNKDIRVWDNDVIPFVKELKYGGYVRIFNEEKDCWTYSKNKPLEKQSLNGEINSFKKGGKTENLKSYKDFIKYIVDTDRNGGHYDYEGFWNDQNARNEWIKEEDTNPGKAHFPDTYKLPTHPTFSTDSKYSNFTTEGGNWSKDEKGNWTFTTSPYVESRSSLEDMLRYFRELEPGVTLVYKGVPYFSPTPAFKNGGQVSVIPEGALHAHKNHMEGAGEDFTAKGIPVIDNNGNLQAEIERNEIIYSKSATDTIEKAYKLYLETSDKEKQDKIAIEIGKFLTKEIIENTLDNTGLIEEVKLKM